MAFQRNERNDDRLKRKILEVDFLFECMIEAHDISRHSTLNIETLGKFKQPKLFTQMFASKP